MLEYQPLDLSGLYNVGPEVYRGDYRAPLSAAFDVATPDLGRQVYWGVPFQIGPQAPCFIGLGPGPGFLDDAAVIPVRSTARYVLIGHALIDSRWLEGEPPGRVIAEYVFRYGDDADPAEARVAIRERFEIAVVPTGWGGAPFLAVEDAKPTTPARYGGDWGSVGRRQTE